LTVILGITRFYDNEDTMKKLFLILLASAFAAAPMSVYAAKKDKPKAEKKAEKKKAEAKKK